MPFFVQSKRKEKVPCPVQEMMFTKSKWFHFDSMLFFKDCGIEHVDDGYTCSGKINFIRIIIISYFIYTVVHNFSTI